MMSLLIMMLSAVLLDCIPTLDAMMTNTRIASLEKMETRPENNAAFKRSGLFHKIQTVQTSPAPTMVSVHDIENLIQQYAKFAQNTTAQSTNNLSKTAVLSDQGKGSPSKVELVQPEPFSKPTSFPPIGKFLMTSSPASPIKPIQSQIPKSKSFGPIAEQFVNVDKISKIKDIPKIPDIESMDDVFKEDDIKNELKRYIILSKSKEFVEKYNHLPLALTRHKRLKKRFRAKSKFVDRIDTRRHFEEKKIIKIPLIKAYNPPFSELRHEVRKHLLGKRTNEQYGINRRVQNKTFLMAPSENHLKNNLGKLLMGTKKVFIPPPAPIQLKGLEPLQNLEPFQKEKDIEDISQHTVKIENPKAIEGIDKHLQTIESQPEIPPIANHVINHEPIKPIEPMPRLR